MSKPRIFVGVGTEVVLRAMIPTARRIMDAGKRSGEGWPEDVFMVMGDSDRRAQHQFEKARLPADRASYVSLSLSQVKEALTRNRDEFRDAWRDEWLPMLKAAPDNGACMVPSLGRLMLKAARPRLMQYLQAIKRRMSDDARPDIFVVLNPLSGTSRGSTYDLPRYLRYVWPDAMITALLIYPVDLETVDQSGAAIYRTNFIEALRILDHYSHPGEYEIYMDPKVGWETRSGELVNNIMAFDHRYGNARLTRDGGGEHRLEGGLGELFEHVVQFLFGVATHDRLADWMLGRLSDVTLHRSGAEVAGHRTHCHAIHETRIAADAESFRAALIERGIQRILEPLAGDARRGGGAGDEPDSLSDGYLP